MAVIKNFFATLLVANTATDVHTVVAASGISFSVNFANNSAEPVTVALYIAATGTPASGECIMPKAIIEAWGTVERTGLLAEIGKHIVVSTTGAAVEVNGYGYEE